MPVLRKRFDFVAVAIDLAILAIDQGKLKVVLLKPQNRAFLGEWVLPGGMVNLNESLIDAAKRHLLAKVGIKNCSLEQLFAFGEVGRDPFGRVISVAYLALLPDIKSIKLQTSPAYESIDWHSAYRLPDLAYDHKKIMASALKRLKSKIGYSDFIKGLLPQEFTAGQLQTAYEAVLQKKVNGKKFIGNMLALKLIKQVKGKSAARADSILLYRFASDDPKVTIEIAATQIID